MAASAIDEEDSHPEELTGRHDSKNSKHRYSCFDHIDESLVIMSAAQYYDNTAKPPTGPYPPQQYQQQPYPQPPYAAQQYAPPSMPPTAPYAEPQGFSNTAPNGGQFVVSDGNEKTGQRFKPKKRFNDPLFAIAYILYFLVFVFSAR